MSSNVNRSLYFESLTWGLMWHITANLNSEPFSCKTDTHGWVERHSSKLKATDRAAVFDELGVNTLFASSVFNPSWRLLPNCSCCRCLRLKTRTSDECGQIRVKQKTSDSVWLQAPSNSLISICSVKDEANDSSVNNTKTFVWMIPVCWIVAVQAWKACGGISRETLWAQ